MGEQLNAGFSETYEFMLDTPSEAQAMTGAAKAEAVRQAADASNNLGGRKH